MCNIAYIRVSTDQQSVENQRYEINQFANNRNIEIDRWVEDTISGTENVRKGNFKKVLKNLSTGDTLIVTEISRMSRTLFDVMGILKTCMERDVSVFSVKENYELGDNIGSKVLAFAFGLAAEIERNMISQRTKEALARKKAEGVKLGRPVGSGKGNCKLDGMEDKVDKLRKKGLSYSKIGRKVGAHRVTVSKFCKQNKID